MDKEDMRNVFNKIKTLGVFLLVFLAGYLSGNFPYLLAQENQLPEWHIIHFLESEGIEEHSHYNQPVILINPFIVPQGEEEKFLKKYDEVSEMLKSKSGFINAKLHRTLNPLAPFAFVNINRWESLAAFKAAVSSPEFKEIHKNFHYEGKASLYEVVKEYEGFEQPKVKSTKQ